MEDFSQLLNQYVRRSGISDAELARATGVSRQTIFRWREGVTGRPRHREDVLAIADMGLVMPPKSTWFAPKLPSGLVIRLLDK